MTDIAIDISADDDEIEVSNPRGFDLRISTPAFMLDMTNERARTIYEGLRPWFDAGEDRAA